jgi:hypothetical protein
MWILHLTVKFCWSFVMLFADVQRGTAPSWLPDPIQREHPPCSSDLAPGNYHLFNPLRTRLGGKRLADEKRRCRSGWEKSQKIYNATGIDTLVKQWSKCISVVGGYVEKYVIYPCSNITCFTFHIHLWPIYWLSLSYMDSLFSFYTFLCVLLSAVVFIVFQGCLLQQLLRNVYLMLAWIRSEDVVQAYFIQPGNWTQETGRLICRAASSSPIAPRYDSFRLPNSLLCSYLQVDKEHWHSNFAMHYRRPLYRTCNFCVAVRSCLPSSTPSSANSWLSHEQLECRSF